MLPVHSKGAQRLAPHTRTPFSVQMQAQAQPGLAAMNEPHRPAHRASSRRIARCRYGIAGASPGPPVRHRPRAAKQAQDLPTVFNPDVGQLTAAQQGEVICAVVRGPPPRASRHLRRPDEPPRSKGSARAYLSDEHANQRQVTVEWPDIRWAPGQTNPRWRVVFVLPFGLSRSSCTHAGALRSKCR